MATNQTVMQKCLEAYDESRALNGLPPVADDLAAKDAEIAALNAKVANALVLVDDAIAADTVADQQEAARLNAAKQALM